MGEGLDCRWVGFRSLPPRNGKPCSQGNSCQEASVAPESQGQFDKDGGNACTSAGHGAVCRYRASRWLRLPLLRDCVGCVGGVEGTQHSLDSVAGPGVDYKPRCSGLKRERAIDGHCQLPERGTVCQNDGKQGGTGLRAPPLEKDTSGFGSQPPN